MLGLCGVGSVGYACVWLICCDMEWKGAGWNPNDMGSGPMLRVRGCLVSGVIGSVNGDVDMTQVMVANRKSTAAVRGGARRGVFGGAMVRRVRVGGGGLDRRGGVLAGCLIALGIVLLIVIGLGIYAAMNWKTWAASAARAMVDTVMVELNLSAEQQAQVRAEVDLLATDFENGNLSLQEFGKVMEEIAESPLIPAAVVLGANAAYITPSTLSEDEKVDARRQIDRLARGIVDEELSADQINTALAAISKQQGSSSSGSVEYRGGTVNVELQEPRNVTPAELRQFIEDARSVADEAGIPDEAFEVDFAVELRRAVDRALGRTLRDPEE